MTLSVATKTRTLTVWLFNLVCLFVLFSVCLSAGLWKKLLAWFPWTLNLHFLQKAVAMEHGEERIKVDSALITNVLAYLRGNLSILQRPQHLICCNNKFSLEVAQLQFYYLHYSYIILTKNIWSQWHFLTEWLFFSLWVIQPVSMSSYLCSLRVFDKYINI